MAANSPRFPLEPFFLGCRHFFNCRYGGTTSPLNAHIVQYLLGLGVGDWLNALAQSKLGIKYQMEQDNQLVERPGQFQGLFIAPHALH